MPSFKRPLLPRLISFKNKESNFTISTQIDQDRVKVEQMNDSFCNRSISNDGDKETVEANINTKRKHLQKLSNDLHLVINNDGILKSKTEALKLSNDSLKTTDSNNLANVEKLLSIEINRQKEKLDEKEKLKQRFNCDRHVYNLYKARTGCEIIIESQRVVKFQFSPGFSVTLHSEDWKSNWSLLDIEPRVKNMNEIEHKFIEVNDIQALLACVYKTLTESKKLPN